MTGSMKAEVTGALKAFLKEGESIQLTAKVDPSIIGGMIVVIGDKYADMSLKTKINKYTALIQQAVWNTFRNFHVFLYQFYLNVQELYNNKT